MIKTGLWIVSRYEAIAFGWNLFFHCLLYWFFYVTGNYGSVHPESWSRERIENNWIFWFWQDLNSGIEFGDENETDL